MQEGGSSTRSRSLENGPHPPLAKEWDYNADAGSGFYSPLVVDNLLILATRSGEVHAVDLRTGSRIGKVSLGDAIEGSPALVDERTLVVPLFTDGTGLVGYDLVRGVRLWQIQDAPHEAGVLYTGESIIAADVHGIVRSINPHTGTVHWEKLVSPGSGFSAAPVLAGSAVVVIDRRGRITSLDPGTGVEIQSVDLNRTVTRAPAVSQNILLIPTDDGVFCAFDHTDMSQRWMIHGESELVKFSSPAVHSTMVVAGATDGFLRAVDIETGQTIWVRVFDGNVSAAPLLTSTHVFAGTYDERVLALNYSTGETVWEHEVPGRVKTSLAGTNDRLIVVSEPKDVISFTITN